MIRDDVLYLIGEDPAAHGVFEAYEPQRRMVFCQVNSVTRNEWYRAREQGMTPVYVFRLSDWHDYGGEKICEYGGSLYRITRTYVDGTAIELTVEAATVDRGDVHG